MATGVFLFNASATSLAVSVNQGPQLPLPATGGQYDWAPYPQLNPPFPTFSSGYPAPNVIGCGAPNALVAYIDQVAKPTPAFQFTIPTGTQFTSVEIYLFYFSATQCTWFALLDGKICAQFLG